MARLRGHTPLDVDRTLYSRRGTVDAPWTIGGKSFVAGDVFTWREIGVPARKLFQLWDQRRIGHEAPRDRNGAENPVELVKPIVITSPKPSKPKPKG